MKRFSTILNRGPGQSGRAPPSGSPEDAVKQAVRAFCESGGPTNTSGDEVTHLPLIVESTESSPPAAAAAAYQIRKYLNKDSYANPHQQYNAIMLTRILVDNPGKPFTKNLDDKFKEHIKHMLRYSRDPSVQQILRETLTSFEANNKQDENLKPLLKMWEKERQAAPMANAPGGYGTRGLYNAAQDPGRVHSNGRPKHALPGPDELAGRIEEARTSAKLLIQFVQTTPPDELPGNDLIKEFADRCQAAQRNLQGYMKCTDPSPDEPTFQTLIETCEQLSLANSKHQRAILAARRQNSQGPPQQQDAQSNPMTSPLPQQAGLIPPLQPSAPLVGAGQATFAGTSNSPLPAVADPFSDSNQVSAFDTGSKPVNGTNTAAAAPAGSQLGAPSQPHTHVDEDEDDLYGATPMKPQVQSSAGTTGLNGSALNFSQQNPGTQTSPLGNSAATGQAQEGHSAGVTGVSGSGWRY